MKGAGLYAFMLSVNKGRTSSGQALRFRKRSGCFPWKQRVLTNRLVASLQASRRVQGDDDLQTLPH